MNIIVTGSMAYDRIMDFPGRFREHILPDKIHILNVSFVLNKLEERFGGTAGNIAYNLNLLGVSSTIVAAMGADSRRYILYLNKLGIDTKYIFIFKNEYTALANIITDKDNNQITAFYPGALTLGKSVEMPNQFQGEGNFLVIAPSDVLEMQKHWRDAQKNNTPYMFDPGQQILGLSKDQLQEAALGSSVSIFNDYEWEVFKKKTNLSLHNLTNKNIVVVVTQGEQGSNIYSNGREYDISAVKIKTCLDPTGAGDAYRSGIILGYANKWDWQVAGQVASTIASFAVEEYGTQIHKPPISGFNKRYKENFTEESPL